MRAAAAAACRHHAVTHLLATRPASTSSPLPVIQADVIVVGAGVVGLATARALARRGREVLVLDARSAFGAGTSSRSSEVVHAGVFEKQKNARGMRTRVFAFFFPSLRPWPHGSHPSSRLFVPPPTQASTTRRLH